MRFTATLTVPCIVCGEQEKNGNTVWIPKMEFRGRENAQPVEMESFCLMCATAYFGDIFMGLKMRELLQQLASDIQDEDAEIDEALEKKAKVN